jgi:L-ascorbate 6-phosphate lactonase
VTTGVAKSIQRLSVPSRSVAIFWLGQAGFVFKTAGGKIAYVDPYLTDSVERLVGYKRIMAGVISPAEVRADAVLLTHHHEDHLDIDAIPIIAKKTRAHFVAPGESVRKLLGLGIDKARISEVREGSQAPLGFVTVRAVHADHGDLAPDAVGYVLDFGFLRVYFTGDTAYRPERMAEVVSLKPYVVIPVINGAYGNMGAGDAAALTRDVGAAVVIPCHFWTFIQHGGDPAAFVSECARTSPATRVVLMTQGECCIHGV